MFLSALALVFKQFEERCPAHLSDNVLKRFVVQAVQYVKRTVTVELTNRTLPGKVQDKIPQLVIRFPASQHRTRFTDPISGGKRRPDGIP